MSTVPPLPPFPAGRGPAAARRLRKQLKDIEDRIAVQATAIESLDAAFTAAFAADDTRRSSSRISCRTREMMWPMATIDSRQR